MPWSLNITTPRWLQRYQPLPEDDEAKVKFMTGDNSSSGFLPSPGPVARNQYESWPQYRAKALWLHLCFLAINIAVSTIVLMYGIDAPPFTPPPSLIHSPATKILEYTKHVYNHSEDQSYYVQPPSPEIDERWQNLILGNFVRLSPEDLSKVGRLDADPVLLEDGSGIGLVNAHHEIHCVMGLYQALHPEYYWPNASTNEKEMNRQHVNHCLDYLLQASMCHGDVGFMTLHWDMRIPIPQWRSAQHTCVNWEGLRGWLKERKVPIHEPGFLIHPKFGPAYPDGVNKVPTILDL